MVSVCPLYVSGARPALTELPTLVDQRHDVEARQLPLRVYHGATRYQNDEWVIEINNSDASAAKRFTLFHQAFHILAHRRTTPVFRERGSIAGSFNEVLADYFTSCVLMPREWVKEKRAEVRNLDRMAETFDVTRSAMCIRLRQLGLI